MKRCKKQIAKKKGKKEEKKDLPKGPTAKDFSLKYRELVYKSEKEGDEEAKKILFDLHWSGNRPDPWTNARGRKKWYHKMGISWSAKESSEFTPEEDAAYRKWCRSGLTTEY